MRELTIRQVEDKLLLRVRDKAEAFSRDFDAPDAQSRVNGALVADIYRTIVIPLTKQVEVEYLMLRLTE